MAHVVNKVDPKSVQHEPEEALVTPHFPLTPVTAVRSTLVQSSLLSLRNNELEERYRALLPREHHQIIFGTLEPTWFPMDVVVAHYEACEGLGLSEQEQIDMGLSVGDRYQGVFLRTLARTGKNLGASPLTILSHLGRVWERTYQGGTCGAFRLGPKDARADLYGLPLASIPYFRNAYRGVFMVMATLVSQRAFCKLVPERTGPSRLSYRLSWV